MAVARIAQNVAVIGAGAAGLVAARELLREGHHVTVFEAQPHIGGVWAYTEEVDADLLSRENGGVSVHSSVYRDLRTNLPREVMGFSDFPCDVQLMGSYSKDARQFCSHQEMLSFLYSFTDRYKLHPHIRFNTKVQRLTPLPRSSHMDPEPADSASITTAPRWRVEALDTQSPRTAAPATAEEYDAVVVCNGHFSIPNLPDIQGLDSFPGLQLHSHNYRRNERFKDKVVLVVGSSFSAEDIGREVSLVARRVHMCARSWTDEQLAEGGQVCFGPGKNMSRHRMLKSLTAGREAALYDGTVIKEVDAVIYCTGYLYSYSFLRHLDLIESRENHVYPLYLHMFPPSVAPSLSFVGLCWRVAVFPQFELQSKLIARLLSGRAMLPSRDSMQQSVDQFFEKLETEGFPLKYAHSYDMWSYNKVLAENCGDVSRQPAWLEGLCAATVKSKQAHPDTFRDLGLDDDLMRAAQAHAAKYVEEANCSDNS